MLYTVQVRILCRQEVKIEAESFKEAACRVAAGQGESSGAMEYDTTFDDDFLLTTDPETDEQHLIDVTDAEAMKIRAQASGIGDD